MNSLQSVVLTLSISYALIGALLLIVLVYARLHWSAKAIAVVVTSAFYIASFVGVRGLLGWATVDRLPVAFKLLQARIVEPHSLEGDPGSIYLWVETLDEGNRPSGVPRAYRLPYRDALAEKTDKAIGEIAAGRAAGRPRRRPRQRPRRPDGGRPGIHHAEHHHGDVGRRSLDGRGRDGGPACRRRGVVYAAAAAANAAQGRAIGRIWGLLRLTVNQPGSARGAVPGHGAAGICPRKSGNLTDY